MAQEWSPEPSRRSKMAIGRNHHPGMSQSKKPERTSIEKEKKAPKSATKSVGQKLAKAEEGKQMLKLSSFKIHPKKEGESLLQKSELSSQSKTLLSSFSSKFQPLLSVSELRQSALSNSRMHQKGKQKQPKSARKTKKIFRITKFK